jgi:hypothetical protein
LVPGSLSSISQLPRAYLVHLALAVGVHQRLPTKLAVFATQYLTVSAWLRYRIRRRARALVEDDALLLLEGHADDADSPPPSNTTLTDDELKDACLLRGLPVTGSTSSLRLCLQHHLTTVARARASWRMIHGQHDDDDVDEGLGLLTLHLPILRDLHKRQRRKEKLE